MFSCLECISLFSKVLFWVLWQKFNDCSQLLCHCDLRLNYYVQHRSFFFSSFLFFFLMFVITQSTTTEKSNKKYSFSWINNVAATYFHWMNSRLFYSIIHFLLRLSIYFFILSFFFNDFFFDFLNNNSEKNIDLIMKWNWQKYHIHLISLIIFKKCGVRLCSVYMFYLFFCCFFLFLFISDVFTEMMRVAKQHISGL